MNENIGSPESSKSLQLGVKLEQQVSAEVKVTNASELEQVSMKRTSPKDIEGQLDKEKANAQTEPSTQLSDESEIGATGEDESPKPNGKIENSASGGINLVAAGLWAAAGAIVGAVFIIILMFPLEVSFAIWMIALPIGGAAIGLLGGALITRTDSSEKTGNAAPIPKGEKLNLSVEKIDISPDEVKTVFVNLCKVIAICGPEESSLPDIEFNDLSAQFPATWQVGQSLKILSEISDENVRDTATYLVCYALKCGLNATYNGAVELSVGFSDMCNNITNIIRIASNYTNFEKIKNVEMQQYIGELIGNGLKFEGNLKAEVIKMIAAVCENRNRAGLTAENTKNVVKHLNLLRKKVMFTELSSEDLEKGLSEGEESIKRAEKTLAEEPGDGRAKLEKEVKLAKQRQELQQSLGSRNPMKAIQCNVSGIPLGMQIALNLITVTAGTGKNS
ncbi:MAG: hypothetical protein LBI69_04975 [Puniceicoccales bacterium]|jgi:hypothetical protein|nr:hypothetical protein [Puniceicoccales bacterium]